MKSKVTRKYQITIPKKVRELLDIKVGDEVIWVINEDGSVTLKKVEVKESIRDFIGVWKNNPLSKRFVNSIAAIKWLRGYEDND